MIVKFPHSASRRVFARRPRISKNGTPEERAAKAAAKATTTATVTVLRFDPAAWLDRCAAAGMEVVYSNGSLLFGYADADWDQVDPLLEHFTGSPGAKDAVKELLRSKGGSAVAHDDVSS